MTNETILSLSATATVEAKADPLTTDKSTDQTTTSTATTTTTTDKQIWETNTTALPITEETYTQPEKKLSVGKVSFPVFTLFAVDLEPSIYISFSLKASVTFKVTKKNEFGVSYSSATGWKTIDPKNGGLLDGIKPEISGSLEGKFEIGFMFTMSVRDNLGGFLFKLSIPVKVGFEIKASMSASSSSTHLQDRKK